MVGSTADINPQATFAFSSDGRQPKANNDAELRSFISPDRADGNIVYLDSQSKTRHNSNVQGSKSRIQSFEAKKSLMLDGGKAGTQAIPAMLNDY